MIYLVIVLKIYSLALCKYLINFASLQAANVNLNLNLNGNIVYKKIQLI